MRYTLDADDNLILFRTDRNGAEKKDQLSVEFHDKALWLKDFSEKRKVIMVFERLESPLK
jgi:hypothetical protein